MRPRVKFVYAGLRVRNLQKSIRFYRKLGFRPKARFRMDHGGTSVHLAFRGSPLMLELNFYPKGSPFYEPFRSGTEFDHLGFSTPDPARWLRRAREAGGKLMADLREGPNRLVYVCDPDGNWVEGFGPAIARPRPRPKRRD